MEDVISFRRAVAYDVEKAIPLIYSSGPDAFDYIFHHPNKDTAKDFLTFAFQRKGGEMGYDNHVVAQLNNEVVGIGAVWNGGKTLSFTLSIAWKILRFYGVFAAIGVMLRGLRFESMVRPPGRKEAALAHIGVDPTHQGHGIGKKLMDHLIEIGNELKVTDLVLDVAIPNTRAFQLYDRLGFKVKRSKTLSLKRDHLENALPGHHRMVLGVHQ